MKRLLKGELERPLVWWYLSFAKPGEFLGGVVVQAHGLTTAIATCDAMNINPGGEVRGFEMGPKLPPAVAPEMCYRLLSREEVERSPSASAS